MSDEELMQFDVPEMMVEAGGETVTVRPLTIGQLPAFMRALKGVQFQVGEEGTDVIGLIADHGEAIAEAVAVATGLSVDQVAALAPDDFIGLAEAVVEINADFFARRVLPRFSSALERLAGTAAVAAGSTPSRT